LYFGRDFNITNTGTCYARRQGWRTETGGRGVMVYDVRNNSKAGLRYIAHFVNNKSHTNIVLMGVPHRFDLPDTSCVNKEVEFFNNKLTKAF